MLADNRWDKGLVMFGSPASEATVKVMSALVLLNKEYTSVEISFNDNPLEDNKMGVKSKEWELLSAGYCKMPALCIDGVMYVGSVKIVKMLAEQNNVSTEVMNLIDFVDVNDTKLLEAAKHWGWSGLHESNGYALANKDHYDSYGLGKKDEVWEKDAANVVKAFLDKLEALLGTKREINGFYVGDEFTLADCVLCNWPVSLGGIIGIDMEKRYPKVQANYLKLKEYGQEGMKIHFEQFPGFVGYIQGAMKEKREGGFDINKYMGFDDVQMGA